MKQLLSFFFIVMISCQFLSGFASQPDEQDDIFKSMIDFDTLEQEMIDSGLDEIVEVAPPSKIVVFFRSLVDPLMVKFIIACDYTRQRWRAMMIVVKQKLTFLASEKNETSDIKA